MMASSDFNFRMMEVLERRVKIETDIFKLNMMRDIYEDYKRARADAMRAERKAKTKMAQVKKRVKYVAYFARGETLPATSVRFAWIGLDYCVRLVSFPVAVRILAADVPSAARTGENFSHNRYPEKECEDAPAAAKKLGPLTTWLRKNNYIPRIGSQAQGLIATAAEEINEFAEQRAEELDVLVKASRKELAEIRRIGWKKLKLEDAEPKKPS